MYSLCVCVCVHVVTQNCCIFNSECECYTICVGDAVSFIQFMGTVATEMSQSQIDEVDNCHRGKSFDCFCDASTPEQPNWASLVGEEALAECIQKTFM